MFNNNNKSKKTVNTKNGTQAPSLNIISEGTKVKGNINSQNDLRISGHIEGEAVSKGKMILSATGKIVGNVKAADADIAGKMEGELRVSNKLILRKDAIVDGDIYTKKLLVEEGAQINGACRMGSSDKGLSQTSDSDYEKQTEVKKQDKAKA